MCAATLQDKVVLPTPPLLLKNAMLFTLTLLEELAPPTEAMGDRRSIINAVNQQCDPMPAPALKLSRRPSHGTPDDNRYEIEA